MTRWLYKANAYVAIAIGIVFIVYGPLLEHFYAGRDAARDFFSMIGVASIALAIVTLAVVRSAGSHFMELARPVFGMAYFIIAPITTLASAKMGAGKIVLFADFVLILAIFFLPEFRAARRTPDIVSDWQDEIRENASRQERTRLAQELHDSIKQQLFSIQTNLAAAEARWESDQPAVQQAIAQARSSAREAMAETTVMLDQLQASPLEGVGLTEALRRQGEALAFRTGAQVETRFSLPPAAAELSRTADLSQKVQTAILRIAQEALSNVARHARAKHVRIEFGPSPNQNELLLLIQDDGNGFPNQQTSQGMGLANMRARAQSIGATLTIDGIPGGGCVVSLRLNPALETDRKRAQYRKLFRSNLVVALFSLVCAVGRGYSEGDWLANEMLIIYPVGAVAASLAAVYAGRYLGLRSRLQSAA